MNHARLQHSTYRRRTGVARLLTRGSRRTSRTRSPRRARHHPDKINGKIQRAEQIKVHTMFMIGKRDMEAEAVSVRVHGKGNLGAKLRSEVIVDFLAAIKERRS